VASNARNKETLSSERRALGKIEAKSVEEEN
jgi:hypothetical protein